MSDNLYLQIIQKQQELIDLMMQAGISPSAPTFSCSATAKKHSKANNGIKTFDEEGFKQYLTSKGRSENSIDTYVRGVKSFFKIHKTLSIQHLEEYETELKSKWKPKTVNLRIAGMIAYGFIYAYEIVDEDFVRQLKSLYIQSDMILKNQERTNRQ